MPRELVRHPDHSRRRSLGVALAFIEWFCVHGPGDVQGVPLHPRHGGECLPLDDEFAGLILDCYALDETGRRLYDTVAISRAKGRAKSELAGFVSLAEAFGPVRFCGWAEGGEQYEWRDFVYEYEPGEPMGRPVTYPFIRCLATEESQSGNTYDNILFNLEHGPLAEDLPSGTAGVTRIFLPGGGEVRPSTAAAASRDGGKETLAVFDEPHLYTQPELRQMYRTVDRNLRKRKAAEPWALLTSTMYQPGENSVLEKLHERAKLIAEGKTRGRRLMLDHREAPADVDLTDREQMRAALREVYGPFAGALDLDGIIESEFWNIEKDPEESRRYFFNQPTAARDAWTTHPAWAACTDVELVVADGAPMVMFFDGSKSDDATGLVGCDVETGHVMTLACWEKPRGQDGEGWEVDRTDVDRVVRQVFAERNVVAFFGDVKEFESYIDTWGQDFGERLLIHATAGRYAHPVAWDMRGRVREFTAACERMEVDIRERDVTHDGDSRLQRHVLNARRRPNRYGVSVAKESRDSPHKIDLAVCAIGARMARRMLLASPEWAKHQAAQTKKRRGERGTRAFGWR
ncbi:Terminase [Streptomyces aidingensis]|uniref:Phage terminase-like protein, large subunit, contains N-terminal HTH domain n=1 Tax=Streptomyces aidingensis TaxID=910347 RepID=A0A1I1PWR5_9ACTN|nr:Terminase [Streptomyces aidingensis]SFD14215.1 Phage terminase-like protein, large subunit, contains N-terminal HTH domain [Streptomyces aidingensis]